MPFSAPPPRDLAASLGVGSAGSAQAGSSSTSVASLASLPGTQQLLSNANEAVLACEKGEEASKLAPAFQSSMNSLLSEWKTHSEEIL